MRSHFRRGCECQQEGGLLTSAFLFVGKIFKLLIAGSTQNLFKPESDDSGLNCLFSLTGRWKRHLN